MSKIAVITARGGSKRIPRKNIKDFCGKPILAYSIEAALDSGIFDEVMISTEDDEIAEIAQKYGAKLPFKRSDEAAGDHVMTVDVMIEVAKKYDEMGKKPDVLCCIYPTAPFITANKLREASEIFEQKKADALIPVVRFSFPPQRCFVEDGDYIKYKWKENEFKRSQDLEPFYHDAGQFYFIKTDVMVRDHTLVPEKTAMLEMDELEVQDIDNETDWKLAEIKYRMLHG